MSKRLEALRLLLLLRIACGGAAGTAHASTTAGGAGASAASCARWGRLRFTAMGWGTGKGNDAWSPCFCAGVSTCQTVSGMLQGRLKWCRYSTIDDLAALVRLFLCKCNNYIYWIGLFLRCRRHLKSNRRVGPTSRTARDWCQHVRGCRIESNGHDQTG